VTKRAKHTFLLHKESCHGASPHMAKSHSQEVLWKSSYV